MAAPITTGVWFNKRAIAMIDFACTHTFRSTSDGWEVQIGSSGELVLRLAHGGEHRINVNSGNILRASGEELYLILA